MSQRRRGVLPGEVPRRSAQSYRGLTALLLGMGVMLAVYFYLFGFQTGGIGSPFGFRSVALESGDPALRGLEVRISDLVTNDLKQMRQQRDIVRELARRYVGTELRGDSLDDLRVLQELVDRGVLKPDQVYELQALGVALGDVMAAQLELRWVAVQDELGRSRALRFRETDNLIFPVTMISKRVERDVPFGVRELYDDIKRTVDGLSTRRPSRL